MNTNTQVKLPITNENGCYEMRLESIGGLGANLCGKLLSELGAMYLGLNASAFSSYGSEKRGSPVKSYVRWCSREREILHNSPVERPDLLILFHHALTRSLPITMHGCQSNSRSLRDGSHGRNLVIFVVILVNEIKYHTLFRFVFSSHNTSKKQIVSVCRAIIPHYFPVVKRLVKIFVSVCKVNI